MSQITRRLSTTDCELCEGDLTLVKATEALKELNNNKTPGPDGLTLEFYAKFWNQIGPLLVTFFNACLANSELCESMKTSLTGLAFKKGDKKNLKKLASDFFIEVDYKTCSKALSMRLSKVLEKNHCP